MYTFEIKEKDLSKVYIHKMEMVKNKGIVMLNKEYKC